MTNYEILQYLIADGGFYIRDEHITLLRKAFPDENITPARISALRCSITQCKYVTAEIVYIRSNIRALKVLAVDPQYQTYARARPKKASRKSLIAIYEANRQKLSVTFFSSSNSISC